MSLSDLKDSIELTAAKPQTATEAEAQLFSAYQEQTSEQVVFQNGVLVDSGIDVVFNVTNIEQHIDSEADSTDLSSKITEHVVEIVSITQSTFDDIIDVDQITFTLKDDHETPFLQFMMKAEWITQHASNEIDTQQLIERTVHTATSPKPETPEEARKHLFDQYRDVTSEQLVFQDGVLVDAGVQLTFETPGIRERIGLEEGQVDLASKINERVADSLTREIVELTNIALNAYSELVSVDQIKFSLKREGDEPPTEFAVQIDWIEQSIADEIDDQELIERVCQTLEEQ